MRQKKIQDERKIAVYRDLTRKVFKSRDQGCYTKEALKDTTRLLQANPEFNAVWNYRRETLLQLGPSLDSEFWDNELMFTLAQLKMYPKVYWIWNHRLWTLEHHSESSVKVWERELAMVSKLLKLDARNFHGWHYRRLILDKIESQTGCNRDKEELEFVTDNINKNISNYSAWHQRTVLIPRLFANKQIPDERDFLTQEFAYITNAIFTDAEDQSVWFYIKWFIKNDMVVNALGREEFTRLLQDLEKNIRVINQDDLEFSGKQNNWCLKILIVVEKVQREMGAANQSHTNEYLEQLTDADPLRKNRYMSLGEAEKNRLQSI